MSSANLIPYGAGLFLLSLKVERYEIPKTAGLENVIL
jgi:hypothetical protein